MDKIIPEMIKILQQGGVIAYPTEAVYGLGCDPLNAVAVNRLLALKKRSWQKGLILIAASWEQVQAYVQPLTLERQQAVLATWPGPFTWLFPATSQVPDWVKGQHATVAIRVTAHPIAQALCAAFGRPLISTSANREGQTPARSAAEVRAVFGEDIDLILMGELGGLAQPTEIRDAVTGEIIRASLIKH